jgi:predicted phosphodiesterase
MIIAVISDIHSNLEALNAALEAIRRRDADVIYCLGDIVGYGADPGPCVDLVRTHCAAAVLGNHDEAVARDEGLELLPRNGREAALHNRSLLRPDQLDYLAGLPLQGEAHGLTFVHASPEEPAMWLRLDAPAVAQRQFQYFTTDVCFVGHTHIAGIMANRLGVLRVRRGHRFLINPGSVGQPRDHNPQLSFALFDTDAFTCELVRVPYDVERAVAKIFAANLPEQLGMRLRRGI